MDSQPPAEGFLIELVDNEWRIDQLPYNHIQVPADKLPDPEADNGDSHLTLAEQEQRWTDLALNTLAPEVGISEQVNISNT